MNFRLARDQVVLLRQICEPDCIKQTISSQFFFTFELEGINNKTLNDWTHGKDWVLFPLTSMFASGNTEGLGGTKLTVSLGASH